MAYLSLDQLDGCSQGLDPGSLLYTLTPSPNAHIQWYGLNYHLCAHDPLNFLTLFSSSRQLIHSLPTGHQQLMARGASEPPKYHYVQNQT